MRFKQCLFVASGAIILATTGFVNEGHAFRGPGGSGDSTTGRAVQEVEAINMGSMMETSTVNESAALFCSRHMAEYFEVLKRRNAGHESV